MEKIAWVKRSGRLSRTHLLNEDGATVCGRVIPDLERTTDGGPICARCDRTALPVALKKNTVRSLRSKIHKKKAPPEEKKHYEECNLALHSGHLCAGCLLSYKRGRYVALCRICQALGCDIIEFRPEGIVYLREVRDNVPFAI